ncbi:MAG: Rv3235 family protein [Actinomycetota bacterium]|nr:Rv3235 family protein [Actinomycetota bacterium]
MPVVTAVRRQTRGDSPALRPHLVLLPAPQPQPPETAFPAAFPEPAADRFVQGTLALGFVLPTGLPAEPETAPDLLLLPPRQNRGGPDVDDEWDRPSPTTRDALPDPRGWAARLGQALVETCTAGRPVSQLARWTNEPVYAELAARYAPWARQDVAHRRVAVRERVRSVHVCEPADGVVEACLVVAGGERPHALALRLEGWDGRWLCTAVEWTSDRGRGATGQ